MQTTLLTPLSLTPLSLSHTHISTHRCNELHVHWVEEGERIHQATSNVPSQWHVRQAGGLVHTLQVKLHTANVRERERETMFASASRSGLEASQPCMIKCSVVSSEVVSFCPQLTCLDLNATARVRNTIMCSRDVGGTYRDMKGASAEEHNHIIARDQLLHHMYTVQNKCVFAMYVLLHRHTCARWTRAQGTHLARTLGCFQCAKPR